MNNKEHLYLYMVEGEQHKLLDRDQPHQHLLRPRHHPLHAPYEGIMCHLSSFCLLPFLYLQDISNGIVSS